MQVSRILAAAALSLVAIGSMAQEIDRAPSTFASTRTRAAVAAEAQNARAQGPGQWASGGEVRGPAAVAGMQAPAVVLSRQEVRNQVAAARAAHQLSRTGELM